MMTAREATLRDDFDDETCGAMVRATLSAYLRQEDTLRERIADAVEKSYSKLFFVRMFSGGRRGRGREDGRHDQRGRLLRGSPSRLRSCTAAYRWCSALPAPRLARITNAYTLRLLKRRLAAYGTAEFTSDVADYTPSGKAA